MATGKAYGGPGIDDEYAPLEPRIEILNHTVNILRTAAPPGSARPAPKGGRFSPTLGPGAALRAPGKTLQSFRPRL